MSAAAGPAGASPRPRFPGLLFVLSGPSGAGKGSVRKAWLARHPEVRFAPSVTTRAPRAGERAGVDYVFLEEEAFEARRRSGELAEWARVGDHAYGTPRQPMEEWLGRGVDVVVEKDVQGAMSLKAAYPEAVFVFILPPSSRELRRRMILRGSGSPERREMRLADAAREPGYIGEYDYALVNDEVERAAELLEVIRRAEHCRAWRRLAGGSPPLPGEEPAGEALSAPLRPLGEE
ncbi:MAG: guanylate kinase [Bacillota bacterium]|nr:guanylate kinase [Bacillota bacterium]